MSYLPSREEIRAEMEAMPGLGWMQAYRRLQDRDHLRSIAFRHYPDGAIGTVRRHQMAESIDAFISLSKGEHR